MRVVTPRPAGACEPGVPERGWPSPLGWVPLLVIGAGLAFGLVLWSRWGFLIAFEAIRSYCF